MQAERRATDLREEVGDLRGKLATITAQRDAALHDVEREKAHGQQRVDDLRARHEEENRLPREELVELRGELNRARDEASVQRSRQTEPNPTRQRDRGTKGPALPGTRRAQTASRRDHGHGNREDPRLTSERRCRAWSCAPLALME